MMYYFVHYFVPGMSHIPEEDRIEIARARAVDDLAKELMKHARFKIDKDGNVRGELEFPPNTEGDQMYE